MNVRAFLAKEDGDFLSLHDVLRGMMRANECSYQEAAIVVLRLMNREDYPPIWLFKSAVDGVKEIERDHKVAMDLLRTAARDGEPLTDDIPF
ncbi:hypothetical protein [Dyella tabacisoli]|uniref:Uncharacterized protein n=1 Tax=Dyella tabacisoli TaxID=2282381 RepID=A0A369UT15_9GAMM|nr:hypothetical protein [Dyella tabacisoli]RDD83195.1 hypothetical protein DVJ77_00900 [Dyella tabacisoli]